MGGGGPEFILYWNPIFVTLDPHAKFSYSMITIEAIGKYQLISSPPINQHTMVPITHVSKPIFRCESIGTIFKILRVHLHGVDGRIH